MKAIVWLLATAIVQAEQPATFTDHVGIELVLIHPGQMTEAVFAPACPSADDPAVAGKPGQASAPEILWTTEDIALCEKLAKRDHSAGFPVIITKPFYIGKYEITQAEWTKVMGHNPSVFQGDKVLDNAERHPVENVSWEDAAAFVRELNNREGKRLYRLPSEFEWEYAGRAGGPGQAGWNDIRAQAVQGLRAKPGGAKPTTQMVGSKLPNAWGLYDMLGNVWEWVQDYYNEKTFPDPVPPAMRKQHVLKGAGFVSDVKNAIYATHAAGPADRWDVGFRVVRDLDQ